MTARNSTALRLFALCLALALSSAGCSWLASDGTTSQQRDKQLSVAEAQKAVESARANLVSQEDLNQAKVAAESERKRANSVKATAELMSEATRRRATKNDPNDQKQAPNTFNAIQAANEADNSAKQKEQEYKDLLTRNETAQRQLKQAEDDLITAKQFQANKAGEHTGLEEPKGIQGDTTHSLVSQLSFILLLITLTLLIISLLLIRKRFNDSQKIAQAQFEVLLKKQDESLRRLTALPTELTDTNTRLTNLQHDVKRLLERPAQIQQRQSESNRGYNYPPTPPPYELEIEEPAKATLTFPVSAGSILAHLNGQEPTITLDALRNILIRDSDGKGELVLIQDPNTPYGLSSMVPNTPRFGAREDFYNHYKQFYECDQPKAGEVWVNKPAQVAQVSDGWELRQKGILEIRSSW